jgi:YHS domain-containing protein
MKLTTLGLYFFCSEHGSKANEMDTKAWAKNDIMKLTTLGLYFFCSEHGSKANEMDTKAWAKNDIYDDAKRRFCSSV